MRILVVEDEEIVARRLVRLLGSILGERMTELTKAESLNQARVHLDQQEIDLLFLDLNLHGKDGYALLGDAMSRSFQTIVVSAHADQALRAFELGVTDFVAKPYTEERLRLAIERFMQRDPDLREQLKFLAVRRAGVVEMVPISRVLFIRGAGDYSELHLRGGETRLHDKALTVLETLLPSRFVRVHRSWLVDIDEVLELRSFPGSRYLLWMKSGAEVPVSRTRVDALRAMLA